MAYRSILLKKYVSLRYRYGQGAVDHFHRYPYCEDCGEKRLVCLTIHHIKGGKKESYKTLCFNCHMIFHFSKIGKATFESEQKWLEDKKRAKLDREQRDQKIVKMIKGGHSTREIAGIFGISYVRVWGIGVAHNVRSKRKNKYC